MKDDLTRAIAEALGCVAYRQPRWADGTEGKSWCLTHRKPPVQNVWPCPETERIAAALTPLIDARVRDARADELVRLVTRAKSWMSAQDLCALAIQRAEEVRRA